MGNLKNTCIFEGRIIKDPTFSSVNLGTQVLDKAMVTIAVDRKLSSEKKEKARTDKTIQTADFINLSFTGNIVKVVKDYCPKGKAIQVQCHYVTYQKQNAQTGQTEYGSLFEVDDMSFATQNASNMAQHNNSSNNNANDLGFNYNNNNYSNSKAGNNIPPLFEKEELPF